MASTELTLSSPDLLAEYVRQSDLKGFFEKRLAAPPDHMAMLIRNGQIVDTYRGAHFSVGGMLQGLKSLFVGASHISILLADLKPFSLQTRFQALSRDQVQVQGTATLELQVNPDKPSNIMGLVNRTGCLTPEEVLSRFKPHLTDRVIEATVQRVDAADLRGDRDIQDLIQGDIMREVERVAGDIGMTVRAVSMEWALTETERQSMQEAVLDREQDHMDAELARLRRSVSRNQDATSIRIQSDVDIAKLNSASEEELAMMILASEVRLLDAREDAQRRQELEALAHEITVLREERSGRFENQLAELDHSLDVGDRQARLQRLNDDIQALNQTHLAEMKKLAAFTDLEIRERTALLEQDIARRAQQDARDHVAHLQKLEHDAEDAELRRSLAARNTEAQIEQNRIKAEADARVAQLQAGATMSPEQILAINAGLSADVAAVLAEQARAQSHGHQQSMQLMRDMVSQATDARVASETQAREMFRMGMEGAAAVAHGAGGRSGSASAIGGSTTTLVECSGCGRENDAKAKFCTGCGNKLRA